MKRNRLVRKLLVMLAILFVLFQSISIPLAAASWTGDAWKGDAWNGSDLKWKGDSWKQKGWVQDGWERDGWTQEGWNQDKWSQDGWAGDGVSPIDPATGEPWTGDKIGEINPATGKPWTGDEINGINPATGKPWIGDEINGINPATGKPWTGDEINGINPATGKPWTGDEINGINPATGKPWIGDEINGINPATGKPWTGDEISGINPATGKPWSSDTSNGVNSITGGNNNFIDPQTGLPYLYAPGRISVDKLNGTDSEGSIDPYGLTKYIAKDVIAGQVKFVHAIENGTFNLMKPNGLSNILMNGIKLGLGDSSNGFNTAYDAYLWVDNANSVNTAFKTIGEYSSIPNTSNAGYGRITSAIRNAPIENAGATFGTLAKFNVAAGAVTTVFSTIDTYKNTSKAIDVVKSSASGSEKTAAIAGATESFGSLAMSTGATLSAIPGLQAVGATTVVVGAGIWAASRGVKYVAKHWESIKSGTNKAKKKVGSWFKSIKGAFS